ncbi:MAG TPA: hypothetical protein VGI39_00905 [Polyangiaceae bacterium]|jgi:hypothetical protein
MRRAVGAAGLLAVMLGACGGSALQRAADRGDFAAVKSSVAARQRAGDLGNGEAAGLAKSVAAWEITKAPKEEQLARVRDVRACAPELDDALSDRMKTHDPAGAEAALARVEAGEMSLGAARDHLGDADDAWRAVGARGLVREEDQAARAKAYLDPAPGVRRAALHAALVAKDGRDVEPLAEVARVDPEPIARTDAVRALGAIGGAEVVGKLRDVWTSADEPLREDIAGAWAAPPSWSAGGREELRVLVAAGHGPGAIEAAGAALRGGTRDPEIDDSARALLARTVREGSDRDRLHAIAFLPRAEGALLDALRLVAKDAGFTVRVAALARLAELDSDRRASIAALEAIAGPASPPTPASARAKLALAAAGDTRVQSWIEADLVAPESSTRLSAATALAALGRSGRAAPLLADADSAVRTRAACALILATRGTSPARLH